MSEQPRIFLSYSWSSDEYAERVVALAEQLTADGIHVILDRWDLKEGQDKHEFMEQAVTDSTVRRVLILCDPTYAAKADGREGGVGTETLIISPEVYRGTKQEKFIPVIMERDEAGQVVVPTYLDGRIYIDLSDRLNDSGEYESLVRNIFGRPELVRPPSGRPPAYLEEGRVPLTTGRSFLAFRDAVLRGRPHQMGLLDDYLGKLLDAVRSQTIVAPDTVEDLDKAISASLDSFLPYRDEFLELLLFLGQSDDTSRAYQRLHRFFEDLVAHAHTHKPARWGDQEVENLVFLGWELFLYSGAAALRCERFEAVEPLIEPYVTETWRGDGPKMRSSSVMNGSFRILQEVTQKRLGTCYFSFAAYLLRERATNRALPFESLMEADLVFWLRAAKDESSSSWYPQTIPYAEMMPTLTLFTKAQSKAFFKRLAPALGVTSPEALKSAFESISDDLFVQGGNFWGGWAAYAELFQLSQAGTK
jgi:hypothetical protein